MDRMKTAQLFRKKVSAKILIFVSSSREYVFEAYDVEAFQYLLKPVEDRKLKNVSLCRGGAGGIFLRGLLSRLIHAGRLSA
jgi:two-component SAPR family response regulator